MFGWFHKRQWIVGFYEYNAQDIIVNTYHIHVLARSWKGAIRKARNHLEFLNDPFASATPEPRTVYVDVKLGTKKFLGTR